MKSYENKGRMGACIELENNNYGSMLQSYATQVMLSNYGFTYDLIRYQKVYTPWFIFKSMPRVLNKVVWSDKLAEREKLTFIKAHPEVKESVKKRSVVFDEFRKKYFIAPSPVYKGFKSLKDGSRKYTSFIAGSDQMWSPSGLGSNFYNLMFTYDEAFRMSYASSFGVKKIPWYQRRRTKNYLERIPFISCRENSGKEIIKELTGRDIPVVADPTMLFTGSEWDDMLPCTRVQNGKYIFSYILGNDEAARNEVLKLKEKTGLPIVSIHQYVEADLNFGDVSVEDAGPAEFVDLIRNAEYVCTDSFHGSVFSSIYHKKFIVFNRYAENDKASKNTRIESLCVNLGLESRRFSGDICERINQDIDYIDVDRKLGEIRKNSYEYLESAFDSIPDICR